jgi:uncharacterized RDD family membrane protein YckC/ribosomal protein S27AE
MADETTCAECGDPFPAEDLVQIGDRFVCGRCKPIVVQKFKEGILMPHAARSHYAGFWMRLTAWILDRFIIFGLYLVLAIIFGLMAEITGYNAELSDSEMRSVAVIVDLLYFTFFIGKYGATPAMMAGEMRAIRGDGEKVGYSLALVRFFASLLNLFTFGIGFIMIAFDEEKRGLHDRICNTRVINKK